jgi:hypothetical protein
MYKKQISCKIPCTLVFVAKYVLFFGESLKKKSSKKREEKTEHQSLFADRREREGNTRRLDGSEISVEE